MRIKFQKIRFCCQCEEMLPVKCVKCVKHPERKPVVQEVFECPPILEVCPSGHCVKIQCQHPGCRKKVWKQIYKRKDNPDKLFVQYKTLFCSAECKARFQAQVGTHKCEVRCANEQCPRPNELLSREKRSFVNKIISRAFHSQACQWMQKKIESARGADDDEETIQMLECRAPKHFGEITIHQKVKGSKLFECTEKLPNGGGRCGNRREAAVKILEGIRLASLKLKAVAT